MLNILSIIFILIIILIILLYILKNIESFYEEEVELPSFPSPAQPDPVLGSANNFGGSPLPPEEKVNLNECNKELEILNANYKVYLNDRETTIKNSIVFKETQRKNMDLDAKQVVDVNQNFLKNAIAETNVLVQDIKIAELDKNKCDKQVAPLIEILNELRTCCDSESATSQKLDKQLAKCIKRGPQLQDEITAAKNKYNNIQNKINKLTNNKNQLNQNLIDCSKKNIYYKQILANCR